MIKVEIGASRELNGHMLTRDHLVKINSRLSATNQYCRFTKNGLHVDLRTGELCTDGATYYRLDLVTVMELCQEFGLVAKILRSPQALVADAYQIHFEALAASPAVN